MQQTTAQLSVNDDPAGTRSTGERPILRSLLRGARFTCPACGNGAMFRRYLKVSDHCPACSEALHHHRADDAPPYFTIVIVGHFIVGGILALHKALAPPEWVQLAIWMPLTLVSCLWLLPRVKGALVGLQWALYMHGFDGSKADDPVIEP